MPVSFQRNGVIVWTIAAIVVLIMGYPLAALIAFGLPSLSTSGGCKFTAVIPAPATEHWWTEWANPHCAPLS